MCNPNRTSLFEVRNTVFTFKQPKCHTKMAAQCCHHPERILLRRKTLVQTSAIPHTVKITNYSNKLDSCIRTHHGQRRRCREGQKNLEWEETIGSLTFATIRELRLFETDKAAVMWCKMVPSQSKFSVSLALH